MSLINKMLRDLDARHATAAGQTVLPNEVRPLPEETVPPRVGRGVWLLAGLALAAVAALQTSAYWLPMLVEYNLLPAKLLPVPATMTAPPPPATIVLQMPPPEQMLPLPSMPETPPAEATPSAPPAAPAAPEQPPRQLADSRSNAGLKIDSSLPDVPAAQKSAAVAPAAAPPVAPAKPAKPTMAAAKSTRGGAPVKIEKQQSQESPQERAEAEYRKAVAAFRQGRSSEAIVQLKAALQEDPRHLAARQTLLSLLGEQKQWDDVQSLLKEGLDLMPSQIAWAMALARIQVERGYATGAWETLQKYQAYAEKSADYQGFAGVLLQRLQRPHEAALHYQTAVQIKPEEGRWWLGLGLALEADGRAPEARDAFQHARNASGLTPEMQAVIDKKLR